jgi:prefoldin subunit 5
MKHIRKSGPHGAVRPYNPISDIGTSIAAEDKAAEALDHIAISLSAIDHNLEALTKEMTALAHILPDLLRKH